MPVISKWEIEKFDTNLDIVAANFEPICFCKSAWKIVNANYVEYVKNHISKMLITFEIRYNNRILEKMGVFVKKLL